MHIIAVTRRILCCNVFAYKWSLESVQSNTEHSRAPALQLNQTDKNDRNVATEQLRKQLDAKSACVAVLAHVATADTKTAFLGTIPFKLILRPGFLEMIHTESAKNSQKQMRFKKNSLQTENPVTTVRGNSALSGLKQSL